MRDPDESTRESVVRALGGAVPGSSGVLDVTAAERAERLVALQRQRMLLAGLRDEAESALVAFPATDDSAWSSDAQRVYAARRAELRHELALAVRAIEEALSGVAAMIAVLAAAG